MSDNASNAAEPVWTVIQQAAANDGLHLLLTMKPMRKASFTNRMRQKCWNA